MPLNTHWTRICCEKKSVDSRPFGLTDLRWRRVTAAVVFRKDHRSALSDLAINVYGTHRNLSSDRAEPFAILQALRYAVTWT